MVGFSTYGIMIAGAGGVLPKSIYVFKIMIKNGAAVEWFAPLPAVPLIHSVDLHAAESNPMAYAYVVSTMEAGQSFDQSMQVMPSLLGAYHELKPERRQLFDLPQQPQVPQGAPDTYTFEPNYRWAEMSMWENDQQQRWVLLTAVAIPRLFAIKQELDRLNIPCQFGRGFSRMSLQAGRLGELNILKAVGVYVPSRAYEDLREHDDLNLGRFRTGWV